MYRLSRPQEAIFEMSRFSSDNVTNVAGDVFFNFPVSIETARDTALKYLQLCEAMQTRIVMVNGIPMQEIICEEINSQDISIKEFQSYVEYVEWAKADAQKPIDIFGRLYRLSIIKIGDKVGFYCATHHIINDASSFNIMAKFACEYLRGNTEQIFYSYKDYLETEEKYEQSSRYQRDRDYWINEYNNGEVHLLFETRGVNQKAARESYYINECLSAKIKKFCQCSDVSEYVLFLTAISAYYFRIKQEHNFFIGTPILNRNNIREEKTIGVFVNTVPIGFSIKGNELFKDLCTSTSDKVMSAFRHQRYHYTQLLKDVNAYHGTAERLFDVVVSFLNTKTSDGAEIGWFSTCNQLESLQIHIDDRKNEGRFHIIYDYQTEKFSARDIAMFHEHLCFLLLDAIDNSDKKVCDFEYVTALEKKQLLFDFNNTTVDYPKDKFVHELFEMQVSKAPETIAVIACDKSLTYKELNKEANKIAHSLMELGMGKGDIVAFMLPRRSYLLSTLLGILKTGAAYLPIDPEHPQERIAHMLSDSGAKYCITEETVVDFLHQTNTENPNVSMEGNDICYCIYTSGSTGKPKGTLITHKNVLNYVINDASNVFHKIIKEDFQSIVSITTVGFDIFVTESLLPLANGMRIVLANEEQARQQNKLNTLIKNTPVDVMQTTPTKMKSLIGNKAQLDYLQNIKTIILGGEALSSSLVAQLQSITDAEIFNIYGPTEATVWVTAAEMKGDDIHIGRPMANIQIYIVDQYMNPVPIGVTGELCIAGDCVGAGYLNNPDLTAEKFIDNPFGSGKLYRTGDLAFWREDGNIGYVGRNDFQVKIRGLRIELGEIETAISAIDGILLTVVVVRKNADGRQLLCAFYTGKEKSHQEIRNALGDKLPKYMVPHIITYLEEMPLTASGKINRKALPEINLENFETSTIYVAPETEAEQVLVSSVEAVLECEKVSLLDNFFDLGGDSLKAIELTSKLEGLGYTTQVKNIFDASNMQTLAKELVVAEEETTLSYDSVMPATPAQIRVYTAQSMKADTTLYNIPYVFKVDKLDVKKLEVAINKLIVRHESLRTRFENQSGTVFQVIDDTAVVSVAALESDDILTFVKPFDLTKAPLLRVGYYKNTVMIDMHHIILDGETLPVFFRELNELYMGRELTANVVQYGVFAMQKQQLEESEKYWLSVFNDTIPVLDLPTDYARKEQQSFAGSAFYDCIDIHLHESVLETAKSLGVTPYVFYMSCFSILLAKFSGQEDIVVGMPVSGRNSLFLNTVGMFVNTVALRSKPQGDKSVAEFIQEVKNSSVSAIEHQNYPFGELVKKLQLQSNGRNPLFDVMFAYQSEQMTDIVFGDKTAELLPVPLTSAKYDFTFTILPRKEDVVIMVEYCTELYKQAKIQKFINSFKQILIQCSEAHTLIKDIAVISEDEKKTLVFDLNDTAVKYPVSEVATIYSLFEENASMMPDKTCITISDASVTFGKLLSLSEVLDANIRNITQGTKSIVAVIANRSIEMYAAIYGIIRGGNAYLPISPDYPQERIAYMLKDSNAALVLAQEQFTHFAGDAPCLNMTAFIQNPPEITEVLPCAAKAEDTAYVIYTSGSTGNPKGAMISHKSAINRILWMQEAYPLTSDSVILQKTPYTFDVSVWEIFWWGMCGGSLAASKPGEHFLPAKILEEVYNHKVTHLHFVPSVFDLFLTYLEAHKDVCVKFRSVKHVFLSGEALSASLVRRFYALFDYAKVKLHNLYGPTECAVDVTYYDCIPDATDPVPIGRPIANTAIYVLDAYRNLLPQGVKGELCIGGMNVGQGYLNNIALTTENFIDNPFGEGKLYRTGDLAYIRDDGQIIFCGRMDGQIKLNGQRIEMGEIEAVMGSVSGVDSVAVVVRKCNGRDTLVAYYVGEEKREEDIRYFCQKRLPAYMVPSVIVHLDALPLNASGKLDRKALLALPITESVKNDMEGPLNAVEASICEAFGRILEVNKVGRNSDFFALGGSSLPMISLLSEEPFEDITTTDFIANPTPAKLAALMKGKRVAKFQYVETLWKAEKTDRAIILFPFAGGGAEAYANLVNAIKHRTDDLSVYFVGYLHTKNECEQAAKEVAELSSCHEVYFYSHCVGAAVAMQILECLEENNNFCIKHYIAGGLIPPKVPRKKNVWNAVPDKGLKAILVKAGAPLETVSDSQTSAMLKRFREDTNFSTQYFADMTDKLRCPVSVVISKEDIFTKNYKKTEALWKQYAETVDTVQFIDSTTHYFQSENSDILADILLSVIV